VADPVVSVGHPGRVNVPLALAGGAVAAVVAGFVAGCGPIDHALRYTGEPQPTTRVTDPPIPVPSMMADPPRFPPVELIHCRPGAKGVNVGGFPYGTGVNRPPAELAHAEARQSLLERYPGLQQRLVYRDDTREDYVFEEADGTTRGYFIYTVQPDGTWMTNGSAYC
jgi:hypothetical protein